MSPIEIHHDDKGWDVWVGKEHTGTLSYDECLGFVARLMLAQAPSLIGDKHRWLRTRKAWKALRRESKRKRKEAQKAREDQEHYETPF